MTIKTKFLERPFEVKSVGADGTFTGHGSIFGELDSYRDIVMPGAFSRSLREDFEEKRRKVPMLWQHNSRQPIGVYTKIQEDNIGLYLEGQCNMKVQQGIECHALMEQGALTGLSIGYDTVRYEWDEKEITRKLFDVNLWEVSPVTFPAGDGARINSVKTIAAFTTLSECEDALRDAGFSSKEAATLIARIKATAHVSDSVDTDAQSVNRIKTMLKSLKTGATQ